MHRHDVGAEPGILLDHPLGLRDHEVRLDRHAGGLPHGLDHHPPVAELRHKLAVHHVEVQGRGPGRFEPLHLAGQVPKIAEEQGRQHHGTVGLEGRCQPVEGLACLVGHGRVMQRAAGLR